MYYHLEFYFSETEKKITSNRIQMLEKKLWDRVITIHWKKIFGHNHTIDFSINSSGTNDETPNIFCFLYVFWHCFLVLCKQTRFMLNKKLLRTLNAI